MAYSKYFLYKKQLSYDGGQTWVDTDPLETTTSGEPIATYDTLEECESGTPKFYATYSDGTSYIIDCISTGDTLTSADTRGHSTAYSAMTEAVIGSCVTTIGTYALGWDDQHQGFFDSLTSVTIPDSVTTIGDRAFQGCSGLTRLNSDVDGVFNIPSNVTSIGYAAFGGCTSLTSLTIPSGVTVIDEFTFGHCTSLPSLTIHDNVTQIKRRAFNGCSGLTNVVIGSGVTTIEDGAFIFCTSLQSVTIHATTPPSISKIWSYPFDYTNNCPIYVPSGSVNAYKAASGWSEYASRIQAIP